MEGPSPLLELVIRFSDSLVSRDFILDYFGNTPLVTKEEAVLAKTIRLGKLYTEENKVFVVTELDEHGTIKTVEEVHLPEKYKLSFYKRFQLKSGMIENYSGPDVETTLGVFLLNKVVLVKVFGDSIPYVNGQWDIKKVEAEIAKQVIDKKITPEQVLRYIDAAYNLGSLNDLCVPTLTAKSITSNPEVTALREKLLEQYKDKLHDPNVMMLIEDTLIALDKKLLEGDESNGFMIEGKNYNVQRKRMFLLFGLVESFGDDVTTYNFSKTNLNDGWDLNEMPILANDIRRGSYSRAKSTALGGAESKMLGRNFQESMIVESDCKTLRGLKIKIVEENKHLFFFRNIIESVQNGASVTLTPENISKYIGQEVILRSPMYCQSKDGYCYKCMDSRFEAVGIKLLNIHPINISSTILNMSLKAMHGTKLSMLNMTDINHYLV